MNLLKRLLSFVISIVLIVSTLSFVNVTANAYSYGYYCYSISNGKATITSCNMAISGSITIPSKLGGCPVTKIGSSAFADCYKLTNVTIPNSVTTIDNSAFDWCGLKTLTIGSGVKTINSRALWTCSIKKISVNNKNKYFCSVNGVLFNKSKSKLIRYPTMKSSTSYSIPKSVKTIGDHAFGYAFNLKKVTIPNGVKTIGTNAFFECSSLKTATLPNTVKSLGAYAFCNCLSLKSVKIPNKLTTIKEYTFDDCAKIKSITIPKSVKTIKDGAFFGCEKLKTVTIPKTVKKIGYEAFGHYFDSSRGPTKMNSFKIKGKKGSAAEKYAKKYKFKFSKI